MRYFVTNSAGAVIATGTTSKSDFDAQPIGSSEQRNAGVANLHDHYDSTTKVLTEGGGITPEHQLEQVMLRQADLLRSADVLVNRAGDLGDVVGEKKARAYRQALRLVNNQADMFNVSWPMEPKV